MANTSETSSHNSDRHEGVLCSEQTEPFILGWFEHNIDDCYVCGIHHQGWSSRIDELGIGSLEDTEILCIVIRREKIGY